ncbi:hypothetical protein GCM10009127_20060 [Alteraurantiacibacter aestuarii]|uniref:copper chaperone PCu(A)C n=1 Tax=Alteraurantiacibacter aestuarii TaxID=650004 RepID=UPI0031E1CDFB
MRKAILAAMASAVLAMGIAACSSEPEAPADVAPEGPEGISVSDGRMNLPAVAGNPAAVYFTVTNDSDRDQMIRSASVLGSESAVLHTVTPYDGRMDMQEMTQLSVPAGESLEFKPGELHVMAMNVDENLKVGDNIEVTLTFVGGDKISFPVTIRAPGDDS